MYRGRPSWSCPWEKYRGLWNSEGWQVDTNTYRHYLTRGLRTPLENWRVDRSYNASDHNRYFLRSKHADLNQSSSAQADWGTFTDTLRWAHYGVLVDMSMKKLDKLITKMYDTLQQALDTACPKTFHHPGIWDSHWATEKHEKGKKRVNEF